MDQKGGTAVDGVAPEAAEDDLRVAPVVRTDPGAAPTRTFSGAAVPPGVPGDSFVVFHARRAVDLPARPARFVVHVSADNRYRLFVNGAEVLSGPQRSDVAHWR